MSANRMNVRTVGNRRHGRHGERGSIAVTVVLLLSFVATIALAVAAFVGTQVRLAKAGENKVIGLTLAEAAVDDSIDKLTGDYNTTSVASTIVYTDPPTNATTLGTYTATIGAGAAYGQKKVIATGTPTNGSARRVVAYVTQGTLALGSAAILANGPVAIGGTGNITTLSALSPPPHVADVFANGNINLGGAGVDDGRLVSTGSVTGTGYYPSVTNAPRYVFPTSAQISTQQAAWIAAAQAGTVMNASQVFQGSQTTATITAPAYINGNLQMSSGKTLTITGNGIVYINGNLKTVASSSVINGSALVVGGQLDMGGQATYSVTSVLPTPTLAILGGGDVTLNGGSTNVLWGIIYAVNGGIKVNGNATFTGALVAGGYNSTVSVTGTYNQYFPDTLASLITLPTNPKVTQVLEQ